MKCPICNAEVIERRLTTISGKAIYSIGCISANCPNNIKHAPSKRTHKEALKSWTARSYNGHYRHIQPPDDNTLNIF